MKTVVTLLMAGVLMPLVAGAQEWQAYTYPDPGFTIQFPAVPAVQTGRIKNSTGVPLPMTRYLVRQERIIYTLTVVNYSSTNADALSTIAETERSLGTSGKVTAAAGARVRRFFGRELTVEGPDGARSAIAIFFVNKHLYTVVGQALPPNAAEESGDAVRFQESLQFLEDDGGFFGLFGGANRDRRSNSSVGANSTVGAIGSASTGGGSTGSTGSTGEGRARGTHTPPADAACAGKSAGDAVQLETPGGRVPATCTLVARPDPPPAAPPAP
jgi:hypothetical protein